ncbi:MAG: SurA N-terminal domain-containing protein [Anaerolineae bacterium]|nr:SurA N-terminal domain-containing protein [Anaerolineae bacterium]
MHRLVGLMIVLLFALVACATAEPTPTPVALPTNSAGQELVATVNGQDITLSQFERELARFQQQVNAADPEAARATVLNLLVEQLLIAQDAARQQITVSDAEVDTEVASLQGLAGGDSSWQAWLDDNLYTEAEFRDTVRAGLLTAKMRDLVTADLNSDVLQVHARHILVDTEQEATALLDRLRNGEDFAVLAVSSKDLTTRDSGGDLGWFAQEELIDPALATVAFSLEPMQIAGPIRTTLGFHVIQTLERAMLPLSDDRRAQLAQKQFETWLASLTASARIERYI